MNRIYVFIFATIFSLNMLNAQEIVTDRPDVTESALVVPQGAVQIESGYTIRSLDTDFSDFNNQYYTSFEENLVSLIRIGVSDKFELRFEPSVTKYNTTDTILGKSTQVGVDDFTIGFKSQIIANDKIELAFLNMTSIPTSRKIQSAEEIVSTNLLSLAHSLGDFADVGYNFGINYAFKTEELYIPYSVAIGKGISEKMGIYFELFGDFATQVEDGDTGQNHFFDMGFTYLINPQFQLDLSYGFNFKNLNRQNEDGYTSENFLGFGLSYLFLK